MRDRYEERADGTWRVGLVNGHEYMLLARLPTRVEKQIALLRHLDDHTLLEGVGYKVSDTTFYVD